mmetsp:Transcript_22022/g.74846  ORF Transcript_22022/g.74846 Transcript_22022/m.74846 type:complete len:232 (-) Transcript_22022:55-750(-)
MREPSGDGHAWLTATGYSSLDSSRMVATSYTCTTASFVDTYSRGSPHGGRWSAFATVGPTVAEPLSLASSLPSARSRTTSTWPADPPAASTSPAAVTHVGLYWRASASRHFVCCGQYSRTVRSCGMYSLGPPSPSPPGGGSATRRLRSCQCSTLLTAPLWAGPLSTKGSAGSNTGLDGSPDAGGRASPRTRGSPGPGSSSWLGSGSEAGSSSSSSRSRRRRWYMRVYPRSR